MKRFLPVALFATATILSSTATIAAAQTTTPTKTVSTSAKTAKTTTKMTSASATKHGAGGHMVTTKTTTGKAVTYDCSKAGNKTKAACKK